MTAVEWLFNELDYILEFYPTRSEKVKMLFKQAKAMEKEQIIEAYGVGADCDNEWAEDYYNEKYKK